MRPAFLLATIAALTAALTAAQMDEPPATREGDCSPQVQGNGFIPSPDTAERFLRSNQLKSVSKSVATPQGYTQTIRNRNASMLSRGPGYLGLYYMPYYHPGPCQELCEANPECMAFNIFMERGPTIDPGPGCEDPPSTNLLKCTLWAFPITADMALNEGQYRSDFKVVIRGSRGFVNKQRAKDGLGLIPQYIGRPWF